MTIEGVPESELHVRIRAARHLARVAAENSQDVGSAFRSAFEMSFDRAQLIDDLRDISPEGEQLPQPLTDLEREYIAELSD